ncbi:MAG: DAHL domain-containing protein [Pseudomonadota bacterium]
MAGPRRMWLATSACALLLLAALVLLYARSREFDTADYFEHVALLRQFKQLDAGWERDALRSRVGINNNYDPLNSPLLDHAAVRRQLDTVSGSRDGDDARALRAAVAAFEATLDAKAALIEQFKSHNAVLRNSMTFLPSAAQEILSAPGAATLEPRVNGILLACLLYERAASAEQAGQIAAQLDALEHAGLRRAPALSAPIAIFSAHARTALREQGRVDALLAAIAAAPTGQRLDALDRLLSEQQRRRYTQAQLYRQFLLLFAAALLVLLLGMAARLIHNHALIQRVNAALRQANDRLEQRVEQRTAQLRSAQAELLGAARRAGMAEIATNVLHNVGNVLNSVTVSAGLLGAQVRASRLAGLDKAAALLADQSGELGRFLSADPKGRLLPGYLARLAEAGAEERRALEAELGRLCASVEHIKEIVATQQAYAGPASVVEAVRVGELLEEAMRMSAATPGGHAVEMVMELSPLPPALLDKHQVLQILLNLINNASQALQAMQGRPGRIVLRLLRPRADTVRIEVADNGEGIAAANLERIFAHGYTTRERGHGFGLHSCVLASQGMGGSLRAHSDGPGQGATFTLELPFISAGAEAPA